MGITTFRHIQLQTTVQFAHTRSSGFWFREHDGRASSFTEYGEVHSDRFPSLQSVTDLGSNGQLLSAAGLKGGPWNIEIQGPNILISHGDHPDQHIVLDGDGFSFTPALSGVELLFGLPKSQGFKVHGAKLPVRIGC